MTHKGPKIGLGLGTSQLRGKPLTSSYTKALPSQAISHLPTHILQDSWMDTWISAPPSLLPPQTPMASFISSTADIIG